MTYSVVARDPDSGELGVAVQSHYLGVGSVVPWARPGVGAVATQAMVEIGYGPKMLDLLSADRPPSDALTELVAEDGGGEIRQVAAVDHEGRVAAHTGARCIAEAGHRTGDGWSVQANMMLRSTVPDAMADAFVSATGDLAQRMLAALDAAEAEGGDIRGRQSAALVVVGGDAEAPPWERRHDLRVEDHPDPLGELRRLVALRHAYRTGAWNDPAVAPNPELRFWHALGLASGGEVEVARDLLEPIYAQDDRWRELVRRLPGTGVIPDDGLAARLTDPHL